LQHSKKGCSTWRCKMYKGKFYDGLSIVTGNPILFKNGICRVDVPADETVRYLFNGWSLWHR
jgi:hypothetical protein